MLHNLTAVCVHIGEVRLHLWPVTDILGNCFAKGVQLKWVQTINKIRLLLSYDVLNQKLHVFENFLSKPTIREFCYLKTLSSSKRNFILTSSEFLISTE